MSERRCTTTPSWSSAASGRGSAGASAWTSSRAKSSSTTKAPAARAIRSTSARRSGESTAPVGFWKSGWQTKTRARVAAKASASRSVRTPSASTGTGTGRSPAARMTARMPEYVGDSTRTGEPGAASERMATVSPPWPPEVIRTSPAPIGPAWPPMSRANQPRSSVRPSVGGRSQAPGRRPARPRTAASRRSGSIEACGYPLLRSITSGGGTRRVANTGAARRSRGPESALSAISCQERSPGRPAGAAGTAGAAAKAAARNTPAPGRETTRPSATSTAMARETVTGLTWWRSIRARLEGSFRPSG